MVEEPDRIREDIASTRTNLVRDVDALADRTLPNRVVGRKWAGMKEKMHSFTGTVMGPPRSAGEGMKTVAHKVQDASSTVADRAGEMASDVADTVRETPEMLRRQAQGSPIAVGVIAFGAGLLAASLLPATEMEKRMGETVKEHATELTEPLAESARQIKDDVAGSVSEAAEQVKQTAKDAAQTTMDQTKASAQTVAKEGRKATAQ